MAVQDKSTLKSYFNVGDMPSESNFTDLIDSSPDAARPWDYNITPHTGPQTATHLGFGLTKAGYVLRKGTVGTWDANMIEGPFVWWDVNRQRYGMLYSGYSDDGAGNPVTLAVGVAWSDDLVHWTKDASNPIFTPGSAEDPDSGGVGVGHLMLKDGTYYFFYIAFSGAGYEGGTKNICLATSTDLATWTRHGVIIAPAGSAWRMYYVWRPFVTERNGTYYMFFNATGVISGDSTHAERIGYATSTDLLHWTVDDANSPVLGRGATGQWDADYVGDPVVFKQGNTWYMHYYGHGIGYAQDGIAYTTDTLFPLGWTRHTSNPTLVVGTAGSGAIDTTAAHKPHVFRTPDRHWHFYTAVNATERGIALATNPSILKRAQVALVEEDRSITATGYNTAPNTDVLFDCTDKLNLEFRVLVRGYCTGYTMTMRDARFNTSCVFVLTNAWKNVASNWFPATPTTLEYSYLQAYVPSGATGHIVAVSYEFRWTEP